MAIARRPRCSWRRASRRATQDSVGGARSVRVEQVRRGRRIEQMDRRMIQDCQQVRSRGDARVARVRGELARAPAFLRRDGVDFHRYIDLRRGHHACREPSWCRCASRAILRGRATEDADDRYHLRADWAALTDLYPTSTPVISNAWRRRSWQSRRWRGLPIDLSGTRGNAGRISGRGPPRRTGIRRTVLTRCRARRTAESRRDLGEFSRAR